MSSVQDFSQVTLVFPPAIVSRVDVAHLIQDIERCDQEMIASDTRQRSGIKSVQQEIAPSDLVQSFLSANQLTLGDGRERRALLQALERTKKTLPVVHVTFAAEANREHLEQVIAWLRSHVHSQAVVETGIQPALIAGAYVRTSNQVFDFSLRGALKGGRAILKREIGALRGI